jgi:tricorn protease
MGILALLARCPFRSAPVVLAGSVMLSAAALSAGADPGEARLLGYPDIHEDTVVFVHGGDLWRAPATGGIARSLTSHEGLELTPKISPDGTMIAYTAEYTGSRQVYVMPADGGPPKQLTFYTDVGPMPPRGGFDYWIQDWTPDGKILVRANRTPWGRRMGRYFLVDPDGGLETPLPLPEGGSASIAPDGRKIVYCPISREFRTWKRTRGGRAQDIWIFDLDNLESERLTDDPGTDNFPMWSGETIYFTSDRDHTLNLFARDLVSGSTRKVTDFDTYDVTWPSLGPRAIVFSSGGELYRHDLASGETARIPIRIIHDLPSTVPRFIAVENDIQSAAVSPSGARAVFEARGELFSVPAENGPTRNLSRTQGVREMSPAWSPDGRRIAYLSDATGEYEIWVVAQDGSGSPRQVTHDGEVWRFPPVWSPDARHLAFADRKRRLFVLDVETGEATLVDTGNQGDLDGYRWSPDGRWIVYQTFHPTRLRGIGLYSLDDRSTRLLGDGLTHDFQPVFGADGRTLFFLSLRDYPIRFSDFEFNFLYDGATAIYAATLDPAAPALFPPRSDEETGPASSEDGEANDDAEGDDAPADAPPPTRVVSEGFVSRTVALPGLEPGDYDDLQAAEGAVFYRYSANGEDFDLYRYDLETREAARLVEDVDGFILTADGKKLLYRSGSQWSLASASPGADGPGSRLDLSGLRVKLDPEAEWSQMFDDAWRIGRDWFYDEDMHGVDWEAMRERYGVLVPYVAHRSELDFIFGEMIGELEAGHTYVIAGDSPRVDHVAGGMLGCELEATSSGRYRIAKIYRGESWDPDYRSPLAEPGVRVREGDYLLAVDGIALTTSDNPYRLLEDKADKQVALTVSASPDGDDPRDVTVRTVASELDLRYLDWVTSRMAMADRLSDGRVGYIHLPDTAIDGNRMLQKLFYSQANRDALIVDVRYNGGGFIPDRMIEVLGRHTLSYWDRRDISSMRTPGFAHDGPKAMLINGYSSSGGDALPYYFRKESLGPLIGTRTWGGLIGLSGNPELVDGGAVLYPNFRIYDTDGAWVVENAGVSPDIEVIDLPEAVIAGRDPSLEKAVEVLLEHLDEDAAGPPEPPEPPTMAR